MRRNALICVWRREETAEHAMSCFVRLVRALLGESAIADEKCECGPSLVILGVEFQLSEEGYTLMPAANKAGVLR